MSFVLFLLLGLFRGKWTMYAANVCSTHKTSDLVVQSCNSILQLSLYCFSKNHEISPLFHKSQNELRYTYFIVEIMLVDSRYIRNGVE